MTDIAVEALKDLKDHLKHLGTFIRVNTLAINPDNFKELVKNLFYIEKTQLKEVFLIDVKKPGSLPEFKAGIIHVQSFSSCIVPFAFTQFNNFDLVLDATASPGSKTSHIAALMKNRGVIIANDRKERHNALFGTLSRLGVINAVVTSFDAKNVRIKEYFTKVLLDPPCSALGSHLFAWKRIEENKKLIDNMSRIQKAMILSCFDALKPGGELVYSTCTITAKENEEVIDFLINQRENAKLEHFNLPIKYEKGLDNFNCSSYVKRIYPWHVNSEAFFIAKIRKTIAPGGI